MPYYHEWIALDLDGTLADCSDRLKFILDDQGNKLRHPEKNYEMFFNEECILKDKPIIKNIEFASNLSRLGNLVEGFITGRPVQTLKASETWIRQHYRDVAPTIYMRSGNDFRPDYIVKPELMRNVSQLYGRGPQYILEDRDGVIEAYKTMGELKNSIIIDAKTLEER